MMFPFPLPSWTGFCSESLVFMMKYLIRVFYLISFYKFITFVKLSSEDVVIRAKRSFAGTPQNELRQHLSSTRNERGKVAC